MVPFERLGPVRAFPSYKGQSSFPGWWWCATTGEHVGYESWLERDHLIALDTDPDIVGIASQPFWIHWQGNGKRRRHAPDYFIRRGDGTALVLDVRADDRIESADQEAFDATARACAAVGWAYRRAGAIEPVLAANQRWLAGYRHPRCARPALAVELVSTFGTPMELLDGARAVGDPILVLPTLFHLLWSSQLTADLAASTLGPSTPVVTR